MNSLTVRSPAKINLFLKVWGKRKDGYHEILTLFHRISLVDSLRLTKLSAPGIRIRTNVPSLSVDSRNIIWKAFALLERKFRFKQGVSVDVRKRIPIGGGLGGGSSNAAFFLLGMKKLFGLKISKRELYRLGAKLGADVNFFLSGTRQALGYGKGERLRLLPCRKRFWFVLVFFPKSLSTARVYGAYRPARSNRALFLTKGNAVVKLRRCLRQGRLEEFKLFLKNDLQEASIQLYPAIGKVIRFFETLGIGTALVSGSGATVFAAFSSRFGAEHAARALRKKWRSSNGIFVAHTF